MRLRRAMTRSTEFIWKTWPNFVWIRPWRARLRAPRLESASCFVGSLYFALGALICPSEFHPSCSELGNPFRPFYKLTTKVDSAEKPPMC
jgi:hypothetical protein